MVLLDLGLPDLAGPDVIRQFVEGVKARVLILSASRERQDVLDAVTAGALGYVLKSAGIEELITAVGSIAAGQPVFTPGLAGLVLGEYRRLVSGQRKPGQAVPAPAVPTLSARETEILRLVATGLTYPQIARRLTLSTRTVQNHVRNTLTKLQLHNKAELVRYALENDLG